MSEHGPQRETDQPPTIARYKPYYHELEQGRVYLWCACGRSQSQPFCDGSHRGTPFRPVSYLAREAEEVLFCGCKRTCEPPFCDGHHNNLKDTYDLDDPESPENRAVPPVAADQDGKARLDGGCFVCSIPRLSLDVRGTLGVAPVITGADGALYQSHFYLEAARGESPIVSFGDREVVLLVTGAPGQLSISGRDFAVVPDDGVYIRAGEGFRVRHDSPMPMKLFASVCPKADRPEWPTDLRDGFDGAHPNRVVSVDTQTRHTMGDRFFQMLVDKRIGSKVVTQFIGEIPLSKALPHRHLYEESLVVLTGSGWMWTETRKAPVKAGDVIFLPRKQAHSLECTDPDGMFIAAVIYPGDNPSVNY